MRLITFVAISAVADLALAQFGNIALSSVPQCAQNCLASNTGASGGCSDNDYTCFCKSSGFVNAVSCCLQATCNTTEQKTAITFNVALCNSYNVSIPNYLGCSYGASVSYNASSVSFPSTVVVTALASITTVDSYIPAYVTTSGGPVAIFSGPPMLTGTCTTPVFASFSPSNGVVTQFPYVGCQNQGCCPFNPGDPGPLTMCPHDYFTTSGACCPSGWSLATQALAGGLTYCATEPAELIVPATTAQGGHAAVISNMLFTLRYELGETTPSSQLSAGAIAGVAVGSVLGVLALGLAGLLTYRARQRATQKRRNNATVMSVAATDATTGAEHQEFSPTVKEHHHQSSPLAVTQQHNSAMTMGGGAITEHIVEAPASSEIPSELPSPPPPLRSPLTGDSGGAIDTYYSAPSSAVGAKGGFGALMSPVLVASSPQELPGSTHMHEHHPAVRAQNEVEAVDGGFRGGDGAVESSSPRPPPSYREDANAASNEGDGRVSGIDIEQESSFSGETERVSTLYDGSQNGEGREA